MALWLQQANRTLIVATGRVFGKREGDVWERGEGGERGKKGEGNKRKKERKNA